MFTLFSFEIHWDMLSRDIDKRREKETQTFTACQIFMKHAYFPTNKAGVTTYQKIR